MLQKWGGVPVRAGGLPMEVVRMSPVKKLIKADICKYLLH